MSNPYSFEARRAGYASLWARASLKDERRSQAADAAEFLLTHKDRFAEVAASTGVPWWWMAGVHYREAGGFRGTFFERVLHNGEKIVGTRRKTTLVPAGRGPFASWEEAARDALEHMELAGLPDWGVERAQWAAEAFNGWGYAKRGVNTPYLYAATTLQQRGKYVADRVFDPNHMDQQLGVVAIWKMLAELDAETAASMGAPEGPGGEDAHEDAPPVLARALADYTTQELIDELFTRRAIAEIVQRKETRQ